MLGRLQLGAVGGLEDEADAVGTARFFRSMPAGVVELQHDALVGSGAHRSCEVGEHAFEVGLADAVGDVPDRAAGRGLTKPVT